MTARSLPPLSRRGLVVTLAFVLSTLVIAGASTAPAAAQELAGVALGPDGQPLAGTPVALHRVGGGAGAFIATDTTSSDGAFRFALEPDSAVYFAALRFEGRMYIGPAVQAGQAEPLGDYVVRVDPTNEAGAMASALSGQATRPAPAQPAAATRGATRSSDTGALLLVGLLALAAAAAFFFAAPRYRERRTREALVELATIENALDDASADDDTSRLEEDRDRLRAQLAPRP